MTGKKTTKPKTKCKKSKKTTPAVIGLWGVKITKGMNERKANERATREFIAEVRGEGPHATGAERRKFSKEFERAKSNPRYNFNPY